MNKEQSEHALQAKAPYGGTPLTLRLSIWAIIAVLFTAVMISYSMRAGRLLVAPTYDDVNYLTDAARRIHVWDSTDVFRGIRHWVNNPPHSPGETLLAMTGFAVFGIHDWAAYTANAFLILGLLLGADFLLNGLRMLEKIAVAIFILSVPISCICVTEFRPDCAAGLATALAILLTLREGALNTLRRQIAVGLLWAVALLMKPSIFPLTLGLAAMSFTFHISIRWLGERIPLRQAIHCRAWLLVGATALILAAPHYIGASHHILSYIHLNVIGADREVWYVPGDWPVQLLYFWGGTGGKMMLGEHIWVLTPLTLTGATAMLCLGKRSQRMRLLAIALIMVAAYAVPSINPVKNHFFAVSFDFLLVFSAATALGGIFRTTYQRQWKTIAIRGIGFSVIIIAVLLSRLPEGLFGFGTTQSTDTVMVLRRVQQQIDESIRRNRRELMPTVFCTTGGYADASPIAFLSIARGQELAAYIPYTKTDLLTYRRSMQEASFIIASQRGTGLVYDWLPSAKLQEQALAIAKSMNEFECIAKIPALHGKCFFVFAREDQFKGFDSVTGLDELEGPSSDLHLPRFRWGLGPATRMKLTCVTAEQRTLDLSMWTNLEGQEITVLVNGSEVTRIELRPNSEYILSRASVPLSLDAGENTIELHYARKHSKLADHRPLAVLFTHLAIER